MFPLWNAKSRRTKSIFGDQMDHQVPPIEECCQHVLAVQRRPGNFPFFLRLHVSFFRMRNPDVVKRLLRDQMDDQVPPTKEYSQDVIDAHK